MIPTQPGNDTVVLTRLPGDVRCQIRDHDLWVRLDGTGDPPTSTMSGGESAAPVQLPSWARGVGGDAELALTLAQQCGSLTPLPGSGATAERWEILATIAAQDVTAARVAEAHLDALAILVEAHLDPTRDLAPLGTGPGSTWGVFAAEGAGVRVDAIQDPDGSWSLTGIKPWCSLADRLSHALITAHTDAGRRGLFAIALRDGTVDQIGPKWVSRGLQQVPSGSIELHSTSAIPIGADEWYLTRAGFAWGGAGVAACWFGGAVGLGRSIHTAASVRNPDQIGLAHLGAVDVALTGVRCVLAAAAGQIDDGRADGQDGVILAGRVRAAAAAAAEEVLARSAHALGPAPLAFDADHARRVADLQMYVRQHHAERDYATLGRAVLAARMPW